MGLCKCPKRKVTNLFCFEHDVNVCEYCLVANHERCIVQSYVQWLQDSDYNPICILCKRLLSDDPTIRLVCYDVFHWACLNKYASSLPPTTAPAGYQCPKCKECIFPPGNLVSPVVDALKAKLTQVSWAKIGLGSSLVETAQNVSSDTISQASSNNVIEDETNDFVIVSNKQQNSIKNDLKTSKLTNTRSSNNYPFVHASDNDQQNKNDLYRAFNNDNISKSLSRTTLNNNNKDSNESSPLVFNVNSDRDLAENKYKRRPIFEWLGRLLKSRQVGPSKGLRKLSRQRRCCYLVLLICLCFFTIILIFSRLSSMKTDNDPFLDPMNNPNIRVE